MAQQQNKKDDEPFSPGSILFIVIGFMVWPPLGVVLLLFQLSKLAKQGGRRKNAAGQPSAAGAQTRPAEQPKAAKPRPLSGAGRWQTAVGAVLALAGAAAAVEGLLSVLPVASLLSLLRATYAGVFTLCLGAAGLLWGRFSRRQASRFRRILAQVGESDALWLADLAQGTGLPEEELCAALENMLDKGYLTGRVDRLRGQLILRGPGLAPKSAAPGGGEQDLIVQIRQVNDAIAQPVLSAKIDRIETVTARILAFRQEHPEREEELRTFLQYYLPTTLKILNTYAELEHQGVEGENIRATKQRIENMMDDLVAGFERQLDRLYASDRMDVASDIAVMEQMLRRDGLSGGFQTGSTKS